MPYIVTRLRSGALCVALLFLVAGAGRLSAEVAPDAAAKSAMPEDLSQAELLKSYIRLQEQLHAAQLAIVSNRLEAESAARAQATAVNEKLDAIKNAMSAERERQQQEAQRLQAERDRQQAELERSNHTVLWVAFSFGGIGLLALVVMPLLQWRAINRMATSPALRPQLVAPPGEHLLSDGMAAADQAVTLSNQRLISVIARIERRILGLEQTTAHPLPSATATPNGSPEPGRATESDASISVLLNRARSVVNNPHEAITWYDKILKVAPDHPEALVGKGSALERLKEDVEALHYFDRAIAADRSMRIAYLYKGAVCSRLQRYEEALECYEQALQAEEEVSKRG